MEGRVNYAIVGLFVIGLSVAGIILTVWLLFGTSHTNYDPYVVYVSESVSGLNLKAPVKYSGVDVGFVSEITLREDDPQQVAIKLAIEHGTPISVDTRAELDSQGLTGIAYIELKGGDPNSTLLKTSASNPAVIDSDPSLLFRLDTALGHLSSNLESISAGLSNALNRENTKAFAEILQNMQGITENLQQNSAQIDAIIKNLDSTLQNTAVASEDLPALVKNLNAGTEEFTETMRSLKQASNDAKITFANTAVTAESINSNILPEASQTIDEFKSLVKILKGFGRELEENPGVLLHGRQPRRRGPGE